MSTPNGEVVVDRNSVLTQPVQGADRKTFDPNEIFNKIVNHYIKNGFKLDDRSQVSIINDKNNLKQIIQDADKDCILHKAASSIFQLRRILFTKDPDLIAKIEADVFAISHANVIQSFTFISDPAILLAKMSDFLFKSLSLKPEDVTVFGKVRMTCADTIRNIFIENGMGSNTHFEFHQNTYLELIIKYKNSHDPIWVIEKREQDGRDIFLEFIYLEPLSEASTSKKSFSSPIFNALVKEITGVNGKADAQSPGLISVRIIIDHLRTVIAALDTLDDSDVKGELSGILLRMISVLHFKFPDKDLKRMVPLAIQTMVGKTQLMAKVRRMEFTIEEYQREILSQKGFHALGDAIKKIESGKDDSFWLMYDLYGSLPKPKASSVTGANSNAHGKRSSARKTNPSKRSKHY